MLAPLPGTDSQNHTAKLKQTLFKKLVKTFYSQNSITVLKLVRSAALFVSGCLNHDDDDDECSANWQKKQSEYITK